MAVDANHFLVLGPNGSGLSTALDIFADNGHLTAAGVDPQQLHNTIAALAQGDAPVAFALRLGPDADAGAVASAVDTIKQNLPTLKVLTLDAPEEVLIQRYLLSQKKHPFEAQVPGGLQPAVAADKALHQGLKALKDYSIETHTTTDVELRLKIAKILGKPVESQEFTVYISTFGFKYGIPQDAELMFDMRFMTNPFYDENLRPMNGKDKPVRDFIFNMDHARSFFDKWAALVAEMLPLYKAEGKTRLSIAIGCTGGKHRSVCMAEELAVYLKQHCPAFQIVITHREMLRWGKSPAGTKDDTQQADAQPAPSCPVGEVS
jgi:RNase adapter protein RapZ